MASVSNDGNGRRRVQFVHPDGRRIPIRLGKVDQRTAESFARRVEQLLACMRLNQPMDADLASWVAAQDDRVANKLANSGLIPTRVQREATGLGAFIRRYIDGRRDVKPASKEIWRQGEKGLCDYFGAEADIASITEGMAEDYRQHLIQAELATATIKKRLDFGRQVFRSAVKHRLIPINPFGDVRIKVHLPDRFHFISLEDTDQLIEACPSEDWRIIIALGRFAGLRCPTEVLSLRWCDIDWNPQETVMRVYSPKTEHHPGKDFRIVPVFGLLQPHLQRAREAAPKDAVYVIGGTHREKAMGPAGWRNVNLRTQFLRIIQRAGLKPWPKLFHNLRSSRETELENSREYGLKDISAWMGHSVRIMGRHYLQQQKDAIRKAMTEGRSEAAQNPAQQQRAASGNNQNWATTEAPDRPRSASPNNSSRDPANPPNGEGGIRRMDSIPDKNAASTEGGAKSGALAADQPVGCPDPALATVWHLLPPAAQQKLLEALGGA